MIPFCKAITVGVTNSGVGELVIVGIGGSVDGDEVPKNCRSEIPGGISTAGVSTTSVPVKIVLVATTSVGVNVDVGARLLQDTKIIRVRITEITVLLMIFTFLLFLIFA
jgi:hypothetical protein